MLGMDEKLTPLTRSSSPVAEHGQCIEPVFWTSVLNQCIEPVTMVVAFDLKILHG